MSCGFDFGNRFCVIGVAQKGGVDIALNDVSQRQTSCLVGFGDKERYIGEPAQTQWVRNIRNTISQIKRLIGRKWGEKELQDELPFLPFKVADIGDGELGVEVSFKGNQVTFSVVEILGMLLRQIKTIAETGTNQALVRDVVISVPGFFTSGQRQAVLDASRLASLNCLRLLDETTAVSLSYGIYKTDLSDTDPLRVMFVDMGDSYLSVAIVAFVKGKLKVLAKAYDRTLGGRNFDRLLLEHFCKDVQNRYRLDVKSNPRAFLRMEIACERLKRVLSANSEAQLNLECLMNDIDVRGTITRTEFETLSGPLLERITAPIKQTLADAGLTAEQISSVEVVGGATRIPAVANKITQAVGKPISRTLIAEEAVARGVALQSAILSPIFKVRPYKIEDLNTYPITLVWKDISTSPPSEEKQESTEIFTKADTVPAVKVMTFPRAKPFELTALYSGPELPPGVDPFIGRWIVSEVPSTPNSSEPAKLRVKVKLNLHGIFSVESAEVVETATEDSPALEQSAASPPADKMETDESASQKDGATEKKAEAAPKVVKTTLKLQKQTAGLSEEVISRKIAEEEARVTSDRELRETIESKNALESYIYDAKSALTYDWAEYATDDEKQRFIQQLDTAREWLYGQGEDTKKQVYGTKLQELKKFGDQLVVRKNEHTYRDEAVAALMQAIEHFRLEAASKDPKYSHIDENDRKKVTDKCEEISANMLPKIDKQKALPKTANPSLLISDLTHAKENLTAYCTPILNKPKPPPPKKEEPKKEAADPKKNPEAQKDQAENKSGTPATDRAQEEKETDAMDVDH